MGDISELEVHLSTSLLASQVPWLSIYAFVTLSFPSSDTGL